MFLPGAGNVIRAKLEEKPEVDLWIGGVRFSEEVALFKEEELIWSGTDLALDPSKGVSLGNVCMPTYRTSIFSKLPFVEVDEERAPLSDYLHIEACVNTGYKIDWFEEVIYIVRPDKDEVNGRGQND